MTQKIVTPSQCVKCGNSYAMPQWMPDFLERVAPNFAGTKVSLPLPKHCPDCRKQRRLSFRNDSVLYKRTSDYSGKSILSTYTPKALFPVYDYEEWWGEGWDALDYGQEFDFSRSFVDQFIELRNKVPRVNLQVDNLCENCLFSNQITLSKDCYLLISGSSNESCLYGYRINNSRNCVDCLFAIDSELCYQCVDIFSCYQGQYLQSCSNCSDCLFLFDCQNCQNCLFSYGLRNMSYCIFNEQFSKEEYSRRAKSFDFGSYAAIQQYTQEFAQAIQKFPRRAAQLKQVEDVLGDNIQNAKNCSSVFDGSNLEDMHYCQFVQDCKNCVDINYGCDQTEWAYDVCTTGINAYNILFCIDAWPTVSNLLYCDSCSNGTKDCFGCIGLRRKQYCILNRQYAKAEYEALMPKIIAHMTKTHEWGEFLPPSASPYGYNETIAHEYFPLQKAEAMKTGFQWSEYAAPPARAEHVIAAADLPDHINEVGDDILGQAIECGTSGMPFKIIAQELAFYRTNGIPVPRIHHRERYKQRFKLRPPRQIWKRTCERCSATIASCYPPISVQPNSAEIVYCDSCYLQGLYSSTQAQRD